ncbi:HDOD domain-containing protein [Rhodoferax sp. GW822-FHT02A01]|uniref:HDOD domain-containing protein n=1 Tax=Rhodoferax sp. GW822-FHT02A01 TaxID=3141537 RepID=UPI00315DC85F
MDISPILAHKLAQAVEEMPAFPQSVRKVLTLSQDINCSPKELVHVIDKDPVITVKILRVVNSSYYSIPTKITSLHHAVVYLGFNTVKNLALAIAAVGVLPRKNLADFDVQQYLLHSLTTAGIAKQLADRCPEVDPVDCFIAGLLHDFGKIVLALYSPQEFRMAVDMSQEQGESLHLTLRQVIGVDHSEVGAMLVEKWRFSESLVETIRHQYGPEVLDTDSIACVFAGNQIAKRLHIGFSGNAYIEELPSKLASRLGGGLDALQAALGTLKSLHADMPLVAALNGSAY